MIGTQVGEWTTVDKSEWGPGPWQDEPDKVHWIDGATGLDCLMVRNRRSGNWCGYVGVPEGHVVYGLGYSTESESLAAALERRKSQPLGENPGMGVMFGMLSGQIKASPEIVFEVHGGLTFSGFCDEGGTEAAGICHVAQPGRPEKVWWLGFDCHHCDDLAPGTQKYYREHGIGPLGDDIYRDRAYVENEVTRLAAQLADASPSGQPAVSVA